MSQSMPPDSYCTLGGPGDAEIKIQRSRFVGWAGPAADEETARAFIADLARRYHDSRHVCFGWRLGHAGQPTENRNDDGEPSGTAGEPILAAIRKKEVTNVVVVVVRYFGGVKLGTGGLQRAYGEAADLALAAAPVREVLLGRTFQLALPYPFQKTARHLLESARGRILDEEYTDHVVWKVWLPHSSWQGYAAALTEASAGTVTLEPLDSDTTP